MTAQSKFLLSNSRKKDPFKFDDPMDDEEKSLKTGLNSIQKKNPDSSIKQHYQTNQSIIEEQQPQSQK